MIYFIGIIGILLPRVGYMDLSVVPLALAVLYEYIMKSEQPKVPLARSLIISVALLSIWFVISSFSLIINRTDYLHYVLVPLRTLFLLMGWYLILIRKRFTIDTILIIFICAAVLNSLLIYYQYIVVYFRLDVPLFYHHEFMRTREVTPYRQPGFFAGFSPSSALNAVGAVCAFYMSIGKNIRYYFLYSVVFILLSGSVFLCGRTGLIILVLFLGFNLLFAQRKLRWLSFVWAVALGLLLFTSYPLAPRNLKKTYRVAFEPVFNYIEHRGIGTYSTKDIIQNHYHIPAGTRTRFIGNGLAPFRGGANSDVSFVQLWYGNGILAMVIAAILVLYITSISERSKEHRYIITFIYFSLFVICFKGSYLFSRVVGDLMIILFAANIVLEGWRMNPQSSYWEATAKGKYLTQD